MPCSWANAGFDILKRADVSGVPSGVSADPEGASRCALQLPLAALEYQRTAHPYRRIRYGRSGSSFGLLGTHGFDKVRIQTALGECVVIPTPDQAGRPCAARIHGPRVLYGSRRPHHVAGRLALRMGQPARRYLKYPVLGGEHRKPS